MYYFLIMLASYLTYFSTHGAYATYLYCIVGLQATLSEGLTQGQYLAARAGFEPTTLRSKGIDSTNAPPGPTIGRH